MQNDLSPASAATEARARGDQLSGSISHKDNAAHVANQARPNGADPRLYIPSDIKSGPRIRRTRAQVVALRAAIKALLEESRPQTVRQIFYALTVQRLIAKTIRLHQQDWFTKNSRLA